MIFSHHFPITGTQPPAWLHSNMVGGVAVMTFFTISGYLVTQSWLRDPRWLAFAGKRLLRLWPGMLLALLVDVLLFGPVFHYFADAGVSGASRDIEHQGTRS